MGKKYSLIVKEVNSLFQQYQTRMTLRQIFYRLVAKLIIPNTMNQYKSLSRLLVKARENGEVDYRNIEDRARTTIGSDYGFDSAKEYFESEVESFKDEWMNFTMPMWTSQPKYVEVWVEKDALSRVVSDTARKFRVKTCPSKGYSSFTYVMDGVNRLNNHDSKEIIIFYLGDYDPSGLDITRDLRERLFRYGADVTVKRVALTLEQINRYQLPPMPAKTSDPRLARFIADTGGTDAVELDALEPPVLQKIVADAIQGEIEKELWGKRIKEIQDAKDRLKSAFESVVIDYDEWEED